MYRDDRFLPILVLQILSELAGCEQKALTVVGDGQLNSNRISSKAGEFLEDLITREGDVASMGRREMDAFASST